MSFLLIITDFLREKLRFHNFFRKSSYSAISSAETSWRFRSGQLRVMTVSRVPAGMIVDSPWMPGYCGVNTIDFYTDLDTWMRCYEKVKKDFPEMILFPDYWVEFGMASESAAFGCRTNFFSYQPVGIRHLIDDMDDSSQDEENVDVKPE